ncbi:unnamed protein product [Merluccius merluccius]
MVKHFSVDWMAQSSTASQKTEGDGGDIVTSPLRPHVRCMVQPRQPTSYGRDYLQPKPRPLKAADRTGDVGSASPVDRSTSCLSVSEISGYSSGYESEAAVSEGPSSAGPPQRRLRTKFTPEQIHRLERIFNKHKYLDAGERINTAQKLNLSETQIRTWFQNRRMKLKREVQDVRAHEYVVVAPALSTVVFPPALQYGDFAGQRFPYPTTGHARPAAGPRAPAQQPPPQPMMMMMMSHQGPLQLPRLY